MGKLQFRCTCNTVMEVPRQMVGQVVSCPSCGQHLKVPANAMPVASVAATNMPPTHLRSQEGATKKNIGLIIGLVSLGALLLLATVGVVLWLTIGSESDDSRVADSNQRGIAGANVPASDSSSNAAVAKADVPSRPNFKDAFPSGVQLASVQSRGSGPGGRTKMNIYLPRGEHEKGSLGCVLIAPAGTNLLMGNEVSDDYHDESLPYAEAGFVAIRYSLDGYTDLDSASMSQVTRAYKSYKSAQAGTANAKAVIAFVKQQLPEVDPQRIYVAGHSSAGTIALNNACLLPDDIAACIAYAPCSDPEAFHKEIYAEPQAVRLFPDIQSFDRKYSPTRNAAKFTCPVFVFQAKGDRVVEYRESKAFATKVESLGKAQITFSEFPGGDHYNPMIEAGIPRAIEWLKKLEQ